MSDLAPLAFGAVVSEVTKLGASNVHVIGNGPIVLCALHRLSDMDLNAFQDRLQASAAIADEVASRVASGYEN